MQRLFRELRRREVFRTAGLYVGISWIAIEVASVLLPAFEAPEWVLRALIIVALVGFPITIALAWIYDITDKGIEVQPDASDTIVAPIGGRKMDFVVIGLLSVALVLSLYMNFTSGPVVELERDPVTVLIADFDNRTGDPLFDDSLEQALNIGLEGAGFVTAFSRPAAARLLETLNPGSTLDETGARLVSIREGIKLIVAGGVETNGSGYDLSARMLNPEDGAVIEDFSARAKSKLDVLVAVSSLADSIREELGDTSIDDGDDALGETFTAASLEAVKHYTEAQALSSGFKFEESLPFYEAAVAADPNFGRAYSGWALALFNMGKEDEAKALWEQALSKMDTMTERERYRTLGLYYMAVTGDYRKGIESYQTLVDRFPADNIGYNNLAVAHFMMLDFEKALQATKNGLEIYPTNKLVMSNRALLAMYAGDFADGAVFARELLELDDAMVLAWLPIAMAALAEGDVQGATAAYSNMAEVSRLGNSIAKLGMADVFMFAGDFGKAVLQLEKGIEDDKAGDLAAQLAAKYLALAQARHGQGDAGAAVAALDEALAASQGLAVRVPAALLRLELGDVAYAEAVASDLAAELQPMARAYAYLIRAAIASSQDRHAAALDALRAGVDLADLWLLRFYLGRAYFEAGQYVEALDEFQHCMERRGEAAALFLDEKPTWRYVAALQDWLAKSRSQMRMTAAVNTSRD